MLHKIAFEPANAPPVLIAGRFHFGPGLLLRHASEIDVIERRDEAGAIAAKLAMKINGVKTLVPKYPQGLVHVLFGRRDRRGIHGDPQKYDAVFPALALLTNREQGKEIQIENISNVFGLEESEIFVGLRLRSFIYAIVYLREMDNLCAGRRMLGHGILR